MGDMMTILCFSALSLIFKHHGGNEAEVSWASVLHINPGVGGGLQRSDEADARATEAEVDPTSAFCSLHSPWNMPFCGGALMSR